MSHNDYHVSLCSFLITSLQALKYFRLPSKILSDRPYRLPEKSLRCPMTPSVAMHYGSSQKPGDSTGLQVACH